MFKLKRIYDPPKPSDGYRILVDRIWPRGMSKQKAQVDLWLKEIAPSGALRKWFAHDPERWTEFQKRYRHELQTQSALTNEIKLLEKKHRTITLIYSARDERHNQAVALLSYLKRRS
ncbi:MAG: DUF488 domain-containing protein [Acidobacteriia bacterium]|nr:DUF488 domain-containing protein [Terriglobia bacterium]